MAQFAFLNGSCVEARGLSIRVTDIGILRGYGIFDYFLVRQGIPLFLEDYLQRFFRSAALLGLGIPFTEAQIAAQVYELTRRNGLQEAGVRLLLTGGDSPDGYAPGESQFILLQYPINWMAARDYSEGVKLISRCFQREIPEVKSINYLTGIRHRPEMLAAGAVEILYHDGVFWRETVRGNVFMVINGELFTPESQILLGITRKHILNLASKRMLVHAEEIPLKRLTEATEVFITSSTKGVLPVVAIDGNRVGDGRPGPLTQALAGDWEVHVASYLAHRRQVPAFAPSPSNALP